jgi:hypothetical protein
LSLSTFQAGLCCMLNGSLAEPYEGATIEAETKADAVRRAKEWAATVDVLDGSWLQVLLDGKSVASFKPGEFWGPLGSLGS